jgi:hypothetical protein
MHILLQSILVVTVVVVFFTVMANHHGTLYIQSDTVHPIL